MSGDPTIAADHGPAVLKIAATGIVMGCIHVLTGPVEERGQLPSTLANLN
jgi:hypothetical protein